MIIKKLKNFLEKIDSRRDQLLFPFIKNYWPDYITPNQLTITRIVLAVLLASLLFFGFNNKSLIIFVFCIAILLDLLDGSVARCLKKETKIGASIDPLADRILIIPVAIYSLYKNYKSLLFVLLGIEIINAFGALYYKIKRVLIRPNIFGKTKMVLQAVAFGLILINWPLFFSGFSIITLWTSGGFAVADMFFKRKGVQEEKIN